MLTYAVLLIIVSHALAGATFVSNFKIEEPVVVSPEKPSVALLDQPAEGVGYKLSYADYHVTWEEFKSTFSKRYATIDEERSRYNIFMENVNLIEQHNWEYHNGRSSFYLDINHFADLTNEEYRARSGFHASRIPVSCPGYKPDTKDVPESQDWREKGYVTAVKFQDECGSCWSFATTGAVEAQWFKKTGKLVSLSEQQLMDCSRDYGNNGCHGGIPDFGFQYIIGNGIEEESVYPYEKKEGKCRYDKSKVVANITKCYAIRGPIRSEEPLKAAVGKMGPVAAGIDSRSETFKFYKGGIYDNPDCSPYDTDHAVLVVGYGTLKGQDYWIIKNSWGEEWGEKGFARMTRNKDNQCAIASQASIPVA
ncbi:hypothetical protein BsWGS_27931 [Bradybaena similaris]